MNGVLAERNSSVILNGRTVVTLIVLAILGLASFVSLGANDRNQLLNWIDGAGSLEALRFLAQDLAADSALSDAFSDPTSDIDLFAELAERGLALDPTRHVILFISFERLPEVADGGTFGALAPFAVPAEKRIGETTITLINIAPNDLKLLQVRPLFPGVAITGDSFTERLEEFIWYVDDGVRNIDALVTAFEQSVEDSETGRFLWDDLVVDPFGALYWNHDIAFPESVKLTPIRVSEDAIAQGALRFTPGGGFDVPVEPLAIGAVVNGADPSVEKAYGIFVLMKK